MTSGADPQDLTISQRVARQALVFLPRPLRIGRSFLFVYRSADGGCEGFAYAPTNFFFRPMDHPHTLYSIRYITYVSISDNAIFRVLRRYRFPKADKSTPTETVPKTVGTNLPSIGPRIMKSAVSLCTRCPPNLTSRFFEKIPPSSNTL